MVATAAPTNRHAREGLGDVDWPGLALARRFNLHVSLILTPLLLAPDIPLVWGKGLLMSQESYGAMLLMC